MAGARPGPPIGDRTFRRKSGMTQRGQRPKTSKCSTAFRLHRPKRLPNPSSRVYITLPVVGAHQQLRLSLPAASGGQLSTFQAPSGSLGNAAAADGAGTGAAAASGIAAGLVGQGGPAAAALPPPAACCPHPAQLCRRSWLFKHVATNRYCCSADRLYTGAADPLPSCARTPQHRPARCPTHSGYSTTCMMRCSTCASC